MIGAAEIFTFLFVMLGPIKLLGPFAQRTRGIDIVTVRRIAIWAFVVASILAVGGGFVGRALLDNWQVSHGALQLAGGLVFLLVALQQLLERYEPAAETTPPPLPADPFSAACRLVFPMLLTPYGIATVIALFASSPDAGWTMMVIGLILLVMLLDLVAMLLARRLLVGVAVIVLQVVGAVLAVLQVALAIQFILRGLGTLGLVRG
jgi:multiple antibiotic resistance protein